MRAFLVPLVLASAVLGQSRQNPPCPQFTIPIEITDAKAAPALEITLDQLQVTVNGKPAEPIRLERVDWLPRVVIAADRSGSMDRPSDIRDVTSATRLTDQLLSQIPRETIRGIVVFDETADVFTGSDWDASDVRLRAALHRKPHKQTALLDALETAVGLLQPPEVGDAIVVITDGGDNHSKDPLASRERLERSGVRIFSVATFEPVAPTPEEVQAPLVLRELADATGGKLLEADAMPHGMTPIPIVAALIQHYYLLTLRSQAPGKKLTIKIRLDRKNKSFEHFHVYAPTRAWACEAR